MSKTKQTGFTLLELSIALIILALMVGGVLTGQRMVRHARVKLKGSRKGEKPQQ
jgi:prepilin-type N-terminal cleavage/methylation domain-containing protein